MKVSKGQSERYKHNDHHEKEGKHVFYSGKYHFNEHAQGLHVPKLTEQGDPWKEIKKCDHSRSQTFVFLIFICCEAITDVYQLEKTSYQIKIVEDVLKVFFKTFLELFITSFLFTILCCWTILFTFRISFNIFWRSTVEHLVHFTSNLENKPEYERPLVQHQIQTE